MIPNQREYIVIFLEFPVFKLYQCRYVDTKHYIVGTIDIAHPLNNITLHVWARQDLTLTRQDQNPMQPASRPHFDWPRLNPFFATQPTLSLAAPKTQPKDLLPSSLSSAGRGGGGETKKPSVPLSTSGWPPSHPPKMCEPRLLIAKSAHTIKRDDGW